MMGPVARGPRSATTKPSPRSHPLTVSSSPAVRPSSAGFSVRSKAAGTQQYEERVERGEKVLLHSLDPERPISLSLEVDGFNRSSTATFKPTFRPECKPTRYMQRTMQRLRHVGR